ncbi:hypothetical protein OC842_005935 [Tilletia horrida]|uniref:SUN domain-containing protein n=1 Tax=Tilletia horrida TaxID=155126 RepID=A0AAN6G892_9BASI|nr:hypothetical protein OC842_005935 [Tilletia horrida]
MQALTGNSGRRRRHISGSSSGGNNLSSLAQQCDREGGTEAAPTTSSPARTEFSPASSNALSAPRHRKGRSSKRRFACSLLLSAFALATGAAQAANTTASQVVTDSRPAVGNPGPLLAQLKHRWNFASMDCAAVVHRTNPGAKFASSILSEKKDRYMLSPCPAGEGEEGKYSAGQFVIVELCDDIMIDTIVLGNYEFFSRQFKRFRLRAAAKLHAREEEWYDFGTFRARNTRGLQVFHVTPRADEDDAAAAAAAAAASGAEGGGDVIPGYDGEEAPAETGPDTGSGEGTEDLPPASAMPPSASRKDARFFRYVRIDFLEHYGSEYYCPVSVLRIYGLTALDEFYQDQEEGGDGGASAAVAAVAMNNPIVANVVELADQLDFAYQYAANGWGLKGSGAGETDDSRLIGDGSVSSEGQEGVADASKGRLHSPFDDMPNILDAAMAAIGTSSSGTLAGTSGQWKKEAASSLAAAVAASDAEDAETYRIDVNAGEPHVHVKIPGSGSALGADPVVLVPSKATCAPGDESEESSQTSVMSDSSAAQSSKCSAPASAPRVVSETSSHSSTAGDVTTATAATASTSHATPSASQVVPQTSSIPSESVPQPKSTVQADLPTATSTQSAASSSTALPQPAQASAAESTQQVASNHLVHEVPVNASAPVPPTASESVSVLDSTAVQVKSATVTQESSEALHSANSTQAASNTSLPQQAVANQSVPVPAPSSTIGMLERLVNSSLGLNASATSNDTSTRSATSSSAPVNSTGSPTTEKEPTQQNHQQQQQQPPAKPVTPPPPSGGGAGSESIYRAINKRLAALEYNSTLNLAFIEHSQRLLRDSFTRMAERHQGRIDDMVRALNASNWRQFDLLRRRTQVDLQRALFEAEIRRQQADAERSAMMAQIHLLTEEVLIQKRISLAQLILILGLFTFVALTRGMRGPQLLHTGISSRLGVYSRPSTPVPTSGAASPNLDAGSGQGHAHAHGREGGVSMGAGMGSSSSLFPTSGFIRQRLNRSRRVSAPPSSAASGNPTGASASGGTGIPGGTSSQHLHPSGYPHQHQPLDRSRLSIVMPSPVHNSSLYRLNSGGSSPNGSILELSDLPEPGFRGDHWRERMRSNGPGSVVSFVDEHYGAEEEEEEGDSPEGVEGSAGGGSAGLGVSTDGAHIHGRRYSTLNHHHQDHSRRRSTSTTTSMTSTSIRSGSDAKSIGSLRGGRSGSVVSPLEHAVSVSVTDEADFKKAFRHSMHGELVGHATVSPASTGGGGGGGGVRQPMSILPGSLGKNARKKKRGTSLLGTFGGQGNRSADSVGTI